MHHSAYGDAESARHSATGVGAGVLQVCPQTVLTWSRRVLSYRMLMVAEMDGSWWRLDAGTDELWYEGVMMSGVSRVVVPSV
jgi:hypothetical protein